MLCKKNDRAGPYILGPSLGPSPVKSMSQHVARRAGSSQFRTLKLLTLKRHEDETVDDKQGRMLIHTEHTLLSLLQGVKGVIQLHGLFKETIQTKSPRRKKGGGEIRTSQRLFLVLDCVVAHDFDPESAWRINLQQFLLKERRLPEREALVIFLGVLDIVERLHAKNIVHRDLKLGNMVFDCRSKEVTLINFSLGRHLSSDRELLTDQRGSPAYISPDVLSGKPYKGKASDMWALGVALYTMLFGQFPFFDSSPQDLFRKIRNADYSIPSERTVSENSCDLVRGLLTLDPAYRFTATQAKEKTCAVVRSWRSLLVPADLGTYQVVPELESPKGLPQKQKSVAEVELDIFSPAIRPETEMEDAQPIQHVPTPPSPMRSSLHTAPGTVRNLSPEELAQLLPSRFQTSLPIARPSVEDPRRSDGSGGLIAQFMARIMERERADAGGDVAAVASSGTTDSRGTRLRGQDLRSIRHVRHNGSSRSAFSSSSSLRRQSSFRRMALLPARGAVRRGLSSRRLRVTSRVETPSTATRVQGYVSELFTTLGAPAEDAARISSSLLSRLQTVRSASSQENVSVSGSQQVEADHHTDEGSSSHHSTDEDSDNQEPDATEDSETE